MLWTRWDRLIALHLKAGLGGMNRELSPPQKHTRKCDTGQAIEMQADSCALP